MTNSPILAIPQIGESQNNKYLTANNAVVALEAAEEATLDKTTSGTTDITLTETESSRYKVYTCNGGSGAYEIIFTGEIGGNPTKRVVMVWNKDDQIVTIKTDGSGTTVAVRPGQRVLVTIVGDDVTAFGAFISLTAAYDVAMYFPGVLADGVVVASFMVVRPIEMADNFAGSYGYCGTNPASSAVFSVEKNGSGIGTITVSTLGAFTFATSGSTVEAFVAGDRVDIISPTPDDASLADVTITLAASQTG